MPLASRDDGARWVRPVRAFVGLGSNLGDRRALLSGALRGLRATPGVGQLECSPLYETDPVGPPQPLYLNAVVSLATTLEPRALLVRLQELERAAGRRRGAERNAARTLDLDLLLYGDRVIDEPGLQVPHPRLRERAFVLLPLAELAPRLRLPGAGTRVAELCARLVDRAGVRRLASG